MPWLFLGAQKPVYILSPEALFNIPLSFLLFTHQLVSYLVQCRTPNTLVLVFQLRYVLLERSLFCTGLDQSHHLLHFIFPQYIPAERSIN